MKTFVPQGRRVYLSLIVVFFSSLLALIVMAEPTGKSATSEAKVHIIYTEKPTNNEEPKAYHLRTLSSALGRSVIKKFL